MEFKLERDWSLAHFLSYISALAAVLVLLNLITQILLFSTTELGVDFQVTYTTGQSDSITNSDIMFMPESQQLGRVIISEITQYSDAHYYFLAFLKFMEKAVIIFGLFILWRFFRSVANDKPFEKINYRRLYAIGWIFIFAEIYTIGKDHYIHWLTNDLLSTDSLRILPAAGSPFNFLIIGFVLIVLGYVFKEGHRIFEEQKLTV